MFKIRHKKTGKFSKGGSDMSLDGQYGWATQAGKVWTKIGHLKNHINMIVSLKKTIPEDWEVVEYETIEKEVKPAQDYVDLVRLLKKRHQ